MEDRQYKNRKSLYEELKEKSEATFDQENIYIPGWQKFLPTLGALSLPFLAISFIIDQYAPMTLGAVLLVSFFFTIFYFSCVADKVHHKYFLKTSFTLLSLIPYFFTFYYFTFLNFFRARNFINGGEFDAKDTFGISKAYVLFQKLSKHTITITIIIFIIILFIAFLKYFLRKNKTIVQKRNTKINQSKLIKKFFYLIVFIIIVVGAIEMYDSILNLITYIWKNFIDIFNYTK